MVRKIGEKVTKIFENICGEEGTNGNVMIVMIVMPSTFGQTGKSFRTRIKDHVST